MNTYKLIALDLDGTLNNDQKEITPKTKEALIQAQQDGAIVVLASGRPTPGLYREAQELDIKKYHGMLLSYNGGEVTDIQTDESIYRKALPIDLAKRFLRHLERYDVNPIVDDGKNIYTNKPGGFQIEYESTVNCLPIIEVENIADAITFAPVKILIAAPEGILKPIAGEIVEPFKDQVDAVFSTPFYLEITMPGISKSTSLDAICQKLGITKEEVIAFGDGGNDLSMIQFAGRGVAMGNACEPLKEAADEVTLTNNEDGIAFTLAKYFPHIEF